MTNIKLAHAIWLLRIGNLIQKLPSAATRCASAACRSGPITPPVATNGNFAKFRIFDAEEVLTSPIIVAMATRIELLIRPANARINIHATMPLLNPIL